jgi:hypothetical protein
MAVIIKNNLWKSLIFCFVFLIITGWIFSGRPQIWQNPSIPPRVKEAKAIIEDYTGYTEVDASGYITITSATQITINGDADADAYVYRDMGINWLSGDFTQEFEFRNTGTGGGKWYPWIVANALDGAKGLKDYYAKNSGDGYYFEIRYKNGSVECKLGSFYTNVKSNCSATLSNNTIYYPRVTRSGTTLTIIIYSDSARTNSVSSASVTVGSETPRYIYAINNENKGRTGNTYAGDVYNLELYTFEQSAYRWFNNLNSTDVGTALASQDAAATLNASGDAFRLRILLHVDNSPLPSSGKNFKLQFAVQNGTCDASFTGESYTDVTAATAIAYYNNSTPADGAALAANASDPTHGGDTIVNQTYEELNNFTNSQGAIPAGQDGKWDFSLIDNSAPADTTYCFRVVMSDGTLLDTYSVIPEITTAAGTIVSVSISDGTITYGTLSSNSSQDTTASGLNDTQTATNDGNVSETFNIKGQNSAAWTLAATNGADQYIHEFSTDGGTNWIALSTSYQTLATGVASSGTQDFDLKITTPTSTSSYSQQSVDVTVSAIAS